MSLPDFWSTLLNSLQPSWLDQLDYAVLLQVLYIILPALGVYLVFSFVRPKYAFVALVISSILLNGFYFPKWNIAFWAWGAYLAFYSLALQKFRSYKDDIVDQANTLIMQLNDTSRLQPLSQVAYVQHLPCPPRPEFDRPGLLLRCLAFNETNSGHHPETANRLKRALEGRKKYLSLKEGELGAKKWRGAILQSAQLEGAKLWAANLQRAYLLGANLQGADLWETNLQGADLRKASLKEAKFIGANLQGVRGLTAEQLTQAQNLFGTKLDPRIERELCEKYPEEAKRLFKNPWKN